MKDNIAFIGLDVPKDSILSEAHHLSGFDESDSMDTGKMEEQIYWSIIALWGEAMIRRVHGFVAVCWSSIIRKLEEWCGDHAEAETGWATHPRCCVHAKRYGPGMRVDHIAGMIFGFTNW
jgi:hypothetical protein